MCKGVGNISFETPLEINVLNVNEAPENIHANTEVIRESIAIGQTVAHIIAVDPEGDQVLQNHYNCSQKNTNQRYSL